MRTRLLSSLLLLAAIASCKVDAPTYVGDDDGGDDDGGGGIDASSIDAPPDAEVIPPPDSQEGVTAGMVLIPAGAFWRGCNPDNPNPYPCDSLQLERETPYREITLSQFWIDRTEVMQQDYALCVASFGCTVPAPVPDGLEGAAGYDPDNKPDHPVSNVTWAQARAYCQWRGKRLPTEAEWEKAARGTDGRMFPWGDTAADCTFANWTPCPDTGTHAVGSHPTGASPYGVEDMAGNVVEYVNDFYSTTYYADAPATDPQGPASGDARVVRGGGFPYNETALRVAYRATSSSGDSTDYARGFRCAYSE